MYGQNVVAKSISNAKLFYRPVKKLLVSDSHIHDIVAKIQNRNSKFIMIIGNWIWFSIFQTLILS